ncbi:MAG: hypothetical protein JW812_00715 [Alphaproteobacteria bacterium]|nr:hypothetical protein [Alphaproteobacteria bacterium]MBN2780132.1 hypothetical protein [Alphaproteobacteria bacterium]
MSIQRIIFLSFFIFSTPLLAWRLGRVLPENKVEIICNNTLPQFVEQDIIEGEKEQFCFVSFFEEERWCFPTFDEAATAVCRAAGTQ